MQLSELKSALSISPAPVFMLPNGQRIPEHYHLTEIIHSTKRSLDCGGILRHEERIQLQLWVDSDTEHRLSAEKFLNIVQMAERQLQLPDLEIEVEYQGETIQTFGIAFNEGTFNFVPLQTQCKAKEACGLPVLTASKSCCSPATNCC